MSTDTLSEAEVNSTINMIQGFFVKDGDMLEMCPFCHDEHSDYDGYKILVKEWPSPFTAVFIREHASSTCQCCYILWTALCSLLAEIRLGRGVGMVDRATGPDKLYFSIAGQTHWSEVYSTQGPKRKIGPLDVEIGYHISSDAASDDTIQRIQKEISECRDSHPKCQTPQDPSLPRRILDVSKLHRPFLFVPEKTVSGRYATLSYCWGIPDFMTTTTDTIEERKQLLQWDALPKTFQDAIHITRLLGIQYLWIDALCILQNSERDWKEQSAQMGSIYESSYLTIAATSSKDAHQGFLGPRNPISRQLDVKIMGSDSVFVRPDKGCLPGSGGGFNENVHYPLMNRGWTYQERILSRRVLHFGVDKWFFECRENAVCECGRSPSHQSPLIRSGEDLDPEMAKIRWNTYVERYSRLNFTFETDRLPAFSGLAQRYQHVQPGEYFAGMWGYQLPNDLLWRSYGATRSSAYVAPSWSWACQTDQVTFGAYQKYWMNESAYRLCLVEDIHVDRTSGFQDYYGQITGGYIRLKGPVMFVRYDGSQWLLQDESTLDLSMNPGTDMISGDLCVIPGDLCFDTEEDRKWARGHRFILLGVAMYDSNYVQIVNCLLLRPSFRDTSVFERLGVHFGETRNMSRNPYKELLDIDPSDWTSVTVV